MTAIVTAPNHPRYRAGRVQLDVPHTTAPQRKVRLASAITSTVMPGVICSAAQAERIALFASLATATLPSGIWNVLYSFPKSGYTRDTSRMPPTAIPSAGVSGAQALLGTIERLIDDRATHCRSTCQSGLTPSWQFKSVLWIIDEFGLLAADAPHLVEPIERVTRSGINYGVAVWLGVTDLAPGSFGGSAPLRRLVTARKNNIVRAAATSLCAVA